jgi:hypothetical protein
MALGFIKNILGKHKKKLGESRSGLLEPTGGVRMQIPITFTITQDELDRFGFSPHEQAMNNPRIRSALERVI